MNAGRPTGAKTRGPRLGLSLAWALTAGCALLGHPARHAGSPATPAGAPEQPAAAAAPGSGESESGEPQATAPESGPAQPASPGPASSAPSAAKLPPCLPPAETKSESKPKPKMAKPKVRAAPKPAPPQLPTAPTVEQTPAGGVVNAEVKPLPVAVMSILGKRVRGPKGEDMGRVVDVLADSSGRVRVAIIDFGGFLGVGDRRIAVDWPLLRFNPDGHDPSLLLSVSREKLQTAPEYKDNTRPQTLMEPASAADAPK